MLLAWIATISVTFSNTQHSATAFAPTFASLQRPIRVSSSLREAAADERAQAMTDYMAKSHEEKLRAVKEVEAQKQAEIEALKGQVEELKAGNPSSSIIQASEPTQAPPIEGSIEELQEKLAAYQNFMAQYIVNAQEDKARSVKAAEIAITQKYQDKLNAFMLEGSADAGAITTDAGESDLFKGRKTKMAAAAKAGKSSRWGDAEVERVAGTTVSTTKTIKAQEPKVSASTISSTPPPEVIAADHGLRADGGVKGLTLAERVANGANGAVVSKVSVEPSLYDKRNARIAAAAKSGKQSRWGSEEEGKAVESFQALPAGSGKEIVVSPEVTAADHGLRADGGVAGPSLAERVNLGAQILKE